MVPQSMKLVGVHQLYASCCSSNINCMLVVVHQLFAILWDLYQYC